MNVIAMNSGGASSRALLYATAAGPPPLEPPPPLWTGEIETNDAALERLFADLPAVPIAAVAHRVVHGGLDPARGLEAQIDATVIATIRAATPLAPAHNRAALDGIAFACERFADARQIAVFDDALGNDAPELAQTVTGPPAWRAQFGVRRIGFHGISHRDAIERALALLGRSRAKLIAVHLGSGASACAFDGERIVESTMGMTPMDGAMMGTRAGAIDPGVIFHLLRNGYSAGALEDELNHASGLLGISGISLDTRPLLTAAGGGDARAQFALDLYAYRMAQCVGALFATLGGCDAITFSGPIGQHMPPIRAAIAARLAFAGVALDPALNAGLGEGEPRDGAIHAAGALPVYVIRTLEEWAMVRRAHRFLEE